MNLWLRWESAPPSYLLAGFQAVYFTIARVFAPNRHFQTPPHRFEAMAVPGGVIAIVGTFLLTVFFYAVTAHIAARYVLGDVPVSRALAVGVVPAVVSFLLQQYGPAVSILVAAGADLVAIQAIYRLKYRTAAIVALVHYTVAAILGITIFNLVRLLSTAPT